VFEKSKIKGEMEGGREGERGGEGRGGGRSRERAHFGIRLSGCLDGGTNRVERLRSSEGVLEEHERKIEPISSSWLQVEWVSSLSFLSLPPLSDLRSGLSALPPHSHESTSLLSLSAQRVESSTRGWMRAQTIYSYSTRLQKK